MDHCADGGRNSSASWSLQVVPCQRRSLPSGPRRPLRPGHLARRPRVGVPARRNIRGDRLRESDSSGPHRGLEHRRPARTAFPGTHHDFRHCLGALRPGTHLLQLRRDCLLRLFDQRNVSPSGPSRRSASSDGREGLQHSRCIEAGRPKACPARLRQHQRLKDPTLACLPPGVGPNHPLCSFVPNGHPSNLLPRWRQRRIPIEPVRRSGHLDRAQGWLTSSTSDGKLSHPQHAPLVARWRPNPVLGR